MRVGMRERERERNVGVKKGGTYAMRGILKIFIAIIIFLFDLHFFSFFVITNFLYLLYIYFQNCLIHNSTFYNSTFYDRSVQGRTSS